MASEDIGKTGSRAVGLRVLKSLRAKFLLLERIHDSQEN